MKLCIFTIPEILQGFSGNLLQCITHDRSGIYYHWNSNRNDRHTKALLRQCISIIAYA